MIRLEILRGENATLGYRISYLLAQVDRDVATDAFGLVEIGRMTKQPADEAQFWAAYLRKTGWTVIWAEDELFFFERQKEIAKLAKSAPVVMCVVNETVKASTAMGWLGGMLVWDIHHQGDGDDVSHLDVSGTPPPLFDMLRERAAQGQAEDDSIDHFFDIPLKLAAMESGFRHDATIPNGEVDEYALLEQSAERGFFSRLFGRG